MGPLWSLKFKKKLFICFREVQLFGWTLLRVYPLGGWLQIWSLHERGLGTVTKIVFIWGNHPTPIREKYGVWPVSRLAYFFSKSWSHILLNSFADWKYLSSAVDSENLKTLTCVTQIIFYQTSKTNAKNHFGHAKICKSGGRYNGLILKFSPGRAVTMRDRPISRIGCRDRWVRKTGRRHISTSGLAAIAPGMGLFGQYGRRAPA